MKLLKLSILLLILLTLGCKEKEQPQQSCNPCLDPAIQKYEDNKKSPTLLPHLPPYIIARIEESDTTYRWMFYLNQPQSLMTCKDSTSVHFYLNHFYLDSINNRNDGTPTTIAWWGTGGEIKRSPLSSLVTALGSSFKANSYIPSSGEIISALGFTPYNGTTNPSNYLTNSYVPTWASISGKPTFATVATSGSYNDLSNKPTIPTIKRQETYSGSTNASGNYTVTFGTSYSVAPNIQANIIGGTNTNLIKISSITTTGFTVNVVTRVDVIGLLPTYNNVNGATVDVLVTEK